VSVRYVTFREPVFQNGTQGLKASPFLNAVRGPEGPLFHVTTGCGALWRTLVRAGFCELVIVDVSDQP